MLNTQVVDINSVNKTINQPVNYELQILCQKNEISELKLKLQKLQYEKCSRLEDSLFSPKLYDHYMKMAESICGH